MNILQWLGKDGYDYTWNVRIGAKTPDLIAFKDKEIVIIEIRNHATEISKAVKECSFYLKSANKVYIVLPFNEAKKIQPSCLNLLKKCGIGLIQVNDEFKILIEPKSFSPCNEEVMKRLKSKSLSKTPNHRQINVEEEMRDALSKHSEGLSITDMSKLLQLHRHTVVKYVQKLISSDAVCQRKVGPVKLCYLKKEIS